MVFAVLVVIEDGIEQFFHVLLDLRQRFAELLDLFIELQTRKLFGPLDFYFQCFLH